MGESPLLIAAQVLPWAVFLSCLGAVFVIVERWVVLGKRRISTPQLAARLRTVLRRGEPAELESFCGQKRSPAMNTLRRFADLWRTAQGPRPVLYERAAGEELESMERRLPFLAALAGIIPMLGILALLPIVGDRLPGDAGSSLATGGPIPPAGVAALALITGVIILAAYNLLVVRVRSHMRDLDRLGWELLPHLDSIVGPDGSGPRPQPEVPVFEDDEFFRKKR